MSEHVVIGIWLRLFSLFGAKGQFGKFSLRVFVTTRLFRTSKVFCPDSSAYILQKKRMLKSFTSDCNRLKSFTLRHRI
jgi:hypothetical protein